MYNPNTNGIKCANTLGYNPTIDEYAYNNTIINAGWRRPNVKGGSMWLESGAIAHLYNNLIVDSRFGLKNSTATNGGADTSSRWDYNYYFGHSQTCVNQFQPFDSTTMTGTPYVVAGPHDIRGTVAGQNDPLFVNYPVTGADSSSTGGYLNSTYNSSWDFHLHTNSPAANSGTTNFTPHFNVTGLTFTEGIQQTFYSPNPSATIGAMPANAMDTLKLVVSPSIGNVRLNNSLALQASFTPDNLDSLTYSWMSSNPMIATVDNNGNVSGVSAGMVTIYAMTPGGSLVDSSMITVYSSITDTAIVVTPSTAKLRLDSTIALQAVVYPTDADTLTYNWETSNPLIATVDDNGVVTAVSSGVAEIYAITTDKGLVDSCTVTVYTVSDTSIVVAPHSVYLFVDSTFTLTATVYPTNADTLSYMWMSENPAIATVSADGVVTGVSAGQTAIYGITNEFLLMDSSVVTVSIYTVLPKAVNAGSSLSIYPNPTQTTLNVQFNATTEQSKVSVYSSDGKLLYSNMVTKGIGSVTIPVDVNALAKGLYFIKVENGEFSQTNTFVKQ